MQFVEICVNDQYVGVDVFVQYWLMWDWCWVGVGVVVCDVMVGLYEYVDFCENYVEKFYEKLV